MTIDTGRFFIVDAAPDRAHDAPMACTATDVIGQRLEIFPLVLGRNIRVAFQAGDIRVCC